MKRLLYIIFGLGLFSSCSPTLTPFTENMFSDYRWNDAELQSIQFYLSRDIRLYRDVGEDQSTISNGKIKLVNGRKVEEINFRKGTPGVFLFRPKDGKNFAISFENSETGEEKYLMFGPNEKMSGRYVLLAKDWARRNGKVTYGGNVYETDNESAFAALMVDVDAARRVSVKQTTVSGRKL